MSKHGGGCLSFVPNMKQYRFSYLLKGLSTLGCWSDISCFSRHNFDSLSMLVELLADDFQYFFGGARNVKPKSDVSLFHE